jgi:hypothetical protein
MLYVLQVKFDKYRDNIYRNPAIHNVIIKYIVYLNTRFMSPFHNRYIYKQIKSSIHQTMIFRSPIWFIIDH